MTITKNKITIELETPSEIFTFNALMKEVLDCNEDYLTKEELSMAKKMLEATESGDNNA